MRAARAVRPAIISCSTAVKAPATLAVPSPCVSSVDPCDVLLSSVLAGLLDDSVWSLTSQWLAIMTVKTPTPCAAAAPPPRPVIASNGDAPASATAAATMIPGRICKCSV